MKIRSHSMVKTLLLIAGLCEILAGLLHFPMPQTVFQNQVFANLPPNAANFIILAVFAIGILLVAFGSVTVSLAFKTESAPEILYVYLVIKLFLWFGRILIEYLYPIKINMFGIEPFTVLAMPVLIIEFLLFMFIFLSFQRFKTGFRKKAV